MQRASKKQREEFVAIVTRGLPGVSPMVACDFARHLMRLGATYGRLQEAQCNGAYPFDNGERKVVPCGGEESKGCGAYCVKGSLAGPDKRCPDCRTEANIRKAAERMGCGIEVQGDPRGHTVRVKLPDRTEFVGVPTS